MISLQRKHHFNLKLEVVSEYQKNHEHALTFIPIEKGSSPTYIIKKHQKLNIRANIT